MKTYISFLLALVVTFCTLSYMWVSAAQADTGCRKVGDAVTMCDGAGYQLPEAPRGTVRRLPRVSTHRTAHVRGEHTVSAGVSEQAPASHRVGVTVIVARLGARI